VIEFVVFGEAVPQGSTRAFIPKGWTRAIITTDNKRLKPWRQEVAGMAKHAMDEQRQEMVDAKIPVRVKATFYFEKPKTAKKSLVHKATRPDVDKLARSLLDSLAGIVFAADSQVAQCWVNKAFGSPARAEISVSILEETQKTLDVEMEEAQSLFN
jgi:Holliday junction resolvase RusA-like endonuclease